MGKKVVIIGSGASGLPAIRTCLEYGLEPVCFEKSHDIGGIWRYKENVDTSEGSVMKSTVINTSKEMTAYSDFPPPAEFANFMHNTKMLQYLRDYADHHQLLQYVHFEHTVDEVRRADDYNKTGRWTCTVTNKLVPSLIGIKTGQTTTETFDGVLCCTGHHVSPFSPKFEDEDQYQGQTLHSHSYRNTDGFEDKNVVIVGIGNSGGDAAVELSRIAKMVYIVSRRGAWVVNRIWMWGEPIDIVNTNRLVAKLRHKFPYVMEKFTEACLNFRFDHEKYGLRPNFGPFSSHVTVNDELPNRLACGTVIMKPQIRRFISPKTIEFVDGSKVDDVDILMKATGYSFHFPVLEKGQLIPVTENQVKLFHFMYDPTLKHPETMAIIGLIQPLGSIMPISEMQCRVFCDILSGRSKLPSKSEMLSHIENTMDDMAKQFVASRRHTIQVDYAVYMDELADLIGCRPDWKNYLFNDPKLAKQLLVGPQASYHYRLVGPNPWPEARDTIMTIQNRVDRATRLNRTSMAPKGRPAESVDLWSWTLLAIVILIVGYLFW